MVRNVILSAQSIRQLNILNPFSERAKIGTLSYGLSSCGYDVRVNQSLILHPNDFFLASTFEHFTMPSNIVGIVHDKSTWARRGIALQNTVIEPGWKGWLTLEISNHGSKRIEILKGDPIAQIIFHKLDFPTEQSYTGKYQDQANRPVEAL